MALTKLNAFQKKVADLADVPSMSSAELKSYFDSSPDEVRQALNAVIDVLYSTTTDSGAKNIGVNAISGLSASNVQTALAALKTLADTKTTNTGNHAGTWAGYTPDNFPLDVTREQMFIIAEADTIYNGQSGERYPLGTSMMTISGSQWGYPENYGMVMTSKFSNVRMTQYFHQVAGGLNAYFRHWTVDNGYTSWQKLATDNTVNAAIGAVVKGGKIQCGTLALTIPAFSTKTQTISFPESFGTGPSVTGNVRNSSNPADFPAPSFSTMTSSSCTITAENKTASQVTVNYSWIAMV